MKSWKSITWSTWQPKSSDTNCWSGKGLNEKLQVNHRVHMATQEFRYKLLKWKKFLEKLVASWPVAQKVQSNVNRANSAVSKLKWLSGGKKKLIAKVDSEPNMPQKVGQPFIKCRAMSAVQFESSKNGQKVDGNFRFRVKHSPKWAKQSRQTKSMSSLQSQSWRCGQKLVAKLELESNIPQKLAASS